MNTKIALFSLVTLAPVTFAELVALDEKEMQAASGAGLGFALEDFALVARTSNESETTLKVTGIDDSNGGEIDINWTEFYILGEGSNKGQDLSRKAQIGSYNHPWVFRSVRGSKGLDQSHPDYNPAYSGIGNDVALLEIATDSYTSNLQDSARYAEFSHYQGCVYGQPGCTGLGFDGSGASQAERRVQAELDYLLTEHSQLRGRYSSGTSLSALENGRDLAYGSVSNTDSIAYQETVVDAQFNLAAGVKADAYASWENTLNDTERGETPFLFRPECATSIWESCSSRENAYDDLVVEYFEEVVTLEEYRDELESRETDSTRTGLGQSYKVVTADVDRQKALCGFSEDLTACDSGAIENKRNSAANVDAIALNLSSGVRQRPGLDLGLTFDFRLNRANGTTRDDFLDIDFRGLFIDGTSFKLWSRPSAEDASKNELNAELRLNLFAKELDIRVCDNDDCATASDREAATLNLDNLFIALNLGYGDVQPLKLSATSDGNFVFTLEELDPTSPVANPQGLTAEEFYQDYYANSPKSEIRIGDVRVGANNSIGGITVSGLRAQYLKVTSQDL